MPVCEWLAALVIELLNIVLYDDVFDTLTTQVIFIASLLWS